MTRRNSQAGGFFLMLAIMIGFGWGVAAGDPLKGALAGTAIGIATALLQWLVDRRG